ncbi:inositol-3-phosphate synthase [soil metagenome]
MRNTFHSRKKFMGIKVAIAGVGNCANSLIQGVTFYRDAPEDEIVPGLMHVRFGEFHVGDIEFVAAFDVDAAKVGLDLAEAIWASENNTLKFADVESTGVLVQRGPTLDGLGEYYRELVDESDAPVVDVVTVLRDSGADVLVCYLPVGSEDAVKFYAQAAIDAGVAFVNAVPVFVASDPVWAEKFRAAGVPIIGDDIKSQVGATITHRVLARLLESRGITIDHTYQLNVGGNMDFKNMLERKRLQSKKISKTQSVTSNIDITLPERDIHIGPSDHVPWLDDRKFAFVRLEGHGFGNAPISLEYKLEVWDSPNSAGVVIDALRAAAIARQAGLGGPIESASAYFMKSPAKQHPDDVARSLLEEFIGTYSHSGATAAPAAPGGE